MQFTVQQVGTRHRIKLDISDVKMEGKDKLEPYLLFNGDTYKPISQYANYPKDFENIFRGANWMLNHIHDDEPKEGVQGKTAAEKRELVVKFFATTNYTIKKKMPTMMHSIPSFAEELGEQYFNLIKEVGIVDLFREYAATNVSLQDTSKFGTRPQDTQELTFKGPEMRELMVVALLCKLACPIYGELINNLPEQIGEDGKKKLPPFKESLCSSFLNKTLGEYFAELINKLQYYIHHIVEGMYAKDNDAAAIFSGLTPLTRTGIILSSLLVRNYVLCVLELADSNIVRYTDTLVRTLSQTQDNTANKAQVKPRIGGKSSMNDEGSDTAQMEIDSLVSSGTMDGPIIIETSIDRVIDTYRQQHEITQHEFEECLAHFKNHPIYQTPLNQFVSVAVFGREIGGGAGIEMIGAASYTKLIAILQLVALHMGYYNLAAVLTASKSTTVKIKIPLEEENFRRQAPALQHYRNCRAIFSDSKATTNDLEWDKQMADILDDLTQNNYILNVPECLLDRPIGDTGKILEDFIGHNGERIQMTTAVSEQACLLISLYNGNNYS